MVRQGGHQPRMMGNDAESGHFGRIITRYTSFFVPNTCGKVRDGAVRLGRLLLERLYLFVYLFQPLRYSKFQPQIPNQNQPIRRHTLKSSAITTLSCPSPAAAAAAASPRAGMTKALADTALLLLPPATAAAVAAAAAPPLVEEGWRRADEERPAARASGRRASMCVCWFLLGVVGWIGDSV